jgi:hypothetical protein
VHDLDVLEWPRAESVGQVRAGQEAAGKIAEMLGGALVAPTGRPVVHRDLTSFASEGGTASPTQR